jgi:hypothetical protein
MDSVTYALIFSNASMFSTKPEQFRVLECSDGTAQVQQRSLGTLFLWSTVRGPLIHSSDLDFDNVADAKEFIRLYIEKKKEEEAQSKRISERTWKVVEGESKNV